MRKLSPKKKLALQRETLADLQQVAGGVDTKTIDTTVYYPPTKTQTDTKENA